MVDFVRKKCISVSYYGRALLEGDPILAWSPLANFLLDKALVPPGDRRAEFHISLEHNQKHLSLASKKLGRNRRILVVFEPNAVHPAQHTPRIRQRYGLVLVPSPLQKLDKTDEVYCGGGLPEPQAVVQNVSRFESVSTREFAVTILQENKFSFVDTSLYFLRVDVIRSFSKVGTTVKLAGLYWDRSIFWSAAKQLYELFNCLWSGKAPRLGLARLPLALGKAPLEYFGKVEDGLAFLAKAKFSAVIENDSQYISEKLFNAIQAGCVPLFHGPPLKEFGIPIEVCVFVEQPSAEAFVDALSRLTAENCNEIVEAGKMWLLDPRTQARWGTCFAHNRLYKIVNEKMNELT